MEKMIILWRESLKLLEKDVEGSEVRSGAREQILPS